MPSPSPKPYWIDCLWEKHECWSYDDPKTVQIVHQGVEIRLLLPEYLPEFEVITIAECGEILFLIGRILDENFEFEGMPCGLSVIARRQELGLFSAVVWHEHYPWVFEYLGLIDDPTTVSGTDSEG
jgi:hypothetical protein